MDRLQSLAPSGRAPTIGRGGTDLNMARKPGIASHFFSEAPPEGIRAASGRPVAQVMKSW